MVVGFGAPPAQSRALAWAAIFGETPGAVDLAHRCGGELNTAARVSIFVGQNSP
jgi:hypothetical protein